jgi:hypothetical protein
MATHYTNALPCDTLPNATLPNLTTNGFRLAESSAATQTQIEICPRFMGGCGRTDPAQSCNCIENIDGQFFQVSETNEILNYVNQAKTQIQLYRLDAFVGGLLIGTHLPKIGWMMLSYAATFPVLVAFQHPDVFIKLYNKNPEYFVILVSGLVACQAYALYCIRNLIF